MYDNTFYKCERLGGPCIPMCPRFSFDEYCNYSTLELRYLHPGSLWLVNKNIQEKILDDRDFTSIIHTGQSIKDKVLDQSIDYKASSFKRSASIEVSKEYSIKYSSEDILEMVENIVKRVKGETFTSDLDALKDIVENPNRDAPSELKRLYKLKSEGQLYKSIKLREFVSFISDWIKKKNVLSLVDIEVLVIYILYYYKPSKGDFPYDKVISLDKLDKLKGKTYHLEDSSPMKWTVDRIDKLMTEKDEYIKVIWFDDVFYAWKIYELEEFWDLDISIVTPFTIMFMNILQTVLKDVSFILTTNFIILDYFKDGETYSLVKDFVSLMSTIFKDTSTKAPFESSFFHNQLINMYKVKDEYRLVGDNRGDTDEKFVSMYTRMGVYNEMDGSSVGDDLVFNVGVSKGFFIEEKIYEPSENFLDKVKEKS